MKIKKKNRIIILLVILVLITGAYFFVYSIKNSGLADYNKELKIQNLKEKVTVYRDSFGIPHVIAQNEDDLYKVTGYISAQDRMWQMDLLRRITQGRLSEIFGKDMIENDLILRSLRMPEKSNKIIKKLNPKMLKALENFAEGVNQYIEEDNLPFEFKVLGYKPGKWLPEHSVNLIGYMAWDLEMGWGIESILFRVRNAVGEEKFKDFLPDMNLQKTYIFPDIGKNSELADSSLSASLKKIERLAPPVFKGSNNWAVSGKKSTSGKPIFSNDMHLGLMIPGVWSQIHQQIPGKLDVTGVMLPGQPFVIAGHNQNIAWGMTNVMLDGADFYIESLNPDNPNQYKHKGEWKDMTLKKEKIAVSGADEPIEKIIKFTHRGPIISAFKNIKDKTVSMHWIGNEMSSEIRGVYLLNRAKNWEDFRDACSNFISVSQNIAYADKKGNIGLQCCAGIPKRKAPGYLFYPGDTDAYDWDSFVPFDSLPYSYNPERGYVFSANNRTVGDDYPYYISEWFDLPNRAKRIEQMLTEKEKLSLEDFKRMQNDQHSVLADEIKPILLKYLKKMPDLSSEEKEGIMLLENWDNTYSKEKTAPLLFEELIIVLTWNIVQDELNETLFEEFKKRDLLSIYLINNILKKGGSVLCDDVKTKDKKETLKDMVQQSFKEVFSYFKNRTGKALLKTQWGEFHKLNLQHPLGKNALLNFVFNLSRTPAVGGSYHTVSPYSYDFFDPYLADHGASHRHIYNLDDFDNSFSIIPTGVSGIPSSKHFCDQTEMYVNGAYHPDYTSMDKIKKHAVYKAVFLPK